jgi:hypothetical protein
MMGWAFQDGKDWTVEWSPDGNTRWLIHSYYHTRQQAVAAQAKILDTPGQDDDPAHWRILGPAVKTRQGRQVVR